MERIKFMSEEQTIMEKLFKTLDEKAKVLNEQNGQSFIENLGLQWKMFIVINVNY